MKALPIIFLLLVQMVSAQQKQMSLKDAIIGKYTYLKPDGLEGIKWRGNTHFSYIKGDTLWIEPTKAKSQKQAIALAKLQELTEGGINSFYGYDWLNDNELVLSGTNSINVFNITENKILETINLTPPVSALDFCKKNKTVAYTKGDDLYIKNINDIETRVTHDGGNGIVNGSYVHRREFGIYKGTFWSGKGNYLAFYRKDESMVKDYPLADYMARQAELKSVKYPMAGMKSHHVQIGVYDLATGKTLFLETGKPLGHYLTNITWSPDEKSIYVMELNREQNHMKLNEYNVANGKWVKTLFEEKNKAYVEPLTPIKFSKTNPGEFYYLSRKDGWMHLYKYHVSGKLIGQITKGEWEITKFLGFDANEKHLFMEATKDSPIENNVYKVEAKTGKTSRINNEAGVHHAALSPNGKFLVDTWNSPKLANSIGLFTSDGKLKKKLLEANNPLEGYKLGKNSLFSIKANDGADLYCRMVKPVDFDPNKKYPVIVYVYGGPHSQLVTNSWHNNARWWQYYMASKGYIAFTLDNRGTKNRGAAFENVIHRQLGAMETEDQLRGLEYLKSLPFVDENRIGVHGWSYGGFMVLNMMLKHPGGFKVGVAGGPVVDWAMYEIMYGERYMDTPEENPDGYKKANMLNHVHKLDGKLMLVHGAQDATVVMQHSMKFLRECIKQGKQVDFFVYPTHPHNVRGHDRVHLMEKVSNYFFDHL